jgi:hypothetical protein
VDDGADVGFVDTHAEGDGGDDDFELAGEEVALDALAGGWVEASVVGSGGATEDGGELFGGLARGCIDDGGAVGLLFEELGGELVAAGLGEFDDLDGEVVSAEAVDEAFRIVELELGDDVLLDGGGCGGGEGEDGSGAESREVVAEGAVVGAEVMAPGGDAVGLVDGDECGLAFGEHLGEAGDAHALGCDEEELEGAVEVIAAGLAGVFAGDDEGGAAASDGGELVAEGFACSGGHDEEDVAAVGGGAADGFLVGAEGGESEGLVEEGLEVHAARTVSHIVCLWKLLDEMKLVRIEVLG